MKLKFSLKSSGGFKGLMLAHGEKLVASLVGLCVLVLLYQAISIKALDASKQPQELENLAGRARTKIDEAGAETVQLASVDPSQIVSSIAIINGESYPIDSLNPPLWLKKVKRFDPVLFSIEDPEVNAGFGPIAIYDNTPVPFIQAPVVPQTRRRGGNARQNPRRGRNAPGGPGAGRFGAPGGGGGRAVRGGRQGNQRGAYDDFGGLAVGGGGFQPRRARGNAVDPGATVRPGESRAELRHWVAVLGKVPLAKQSKAFRDALAKADFFQTGEAVPAYFAYEVQRADVTGSGKPEWDLVGAVHSDKITQMTEEWAGGGGEVVDPLYLEPTLSFPLAPIVGRGWGASATHSDIPLAMDAMAAQSPDGGGANKKDGDAKDPASTNLFEPPAGGANQFNRGVRGRPQMSRGGAMRRPGARGRGGVGDDYGGGLPGGRGGMFPGGRRGIGRRGMGFAGDQEVEHYLFRFFDFKVEPGRRYQYRVRLLLFDPNNEVEDQYLEHTVINRRAALPLEKKPYRFTPWSESTPSIVVPFAGRMLAGAVTPASTSRINAEPRMKTLLKQIDKAKGFDAAHEIEGKRRGFVGNLTTSVEVFDPGLGQYTTVDKYVFRTGTVLLDMRGGRRLSKGNDKLTELGEALFLSPAGGLAVRSELDDLDEYKRYLDSLPQNDPMDGQGQPGGRRGGRFQGPPGRGGQRLRPQ